MSDIKSFFNSYARISPSRTEYLAEAGAYAQPGYSADYLARQRFSDGSPMLDRVTPDNYPKLYAALEEESRFRKVDMPACYIDKSGYCTLAHAIPAHYVIHVQPEAYNMYTQRELRALVAHELKHLYQKDPENDKESRLNEFDSDRAAVESTDYKTIRTYVSKAASLMIKEVVPEKLQGITSKFYNLMPNIIAENFYIPLDKAHPSPGARMQAMRQHEKSLKNAPQPKFR